MHRIPSRFVSKMSHDLKTPVGNAIMYTELMADDINSLAGEHPEIEDKLKPLIQYCRNIQLSSSKLINAIQSWGYSYQIEDGTFEMRAMPVDMDGLMRKVIAANDIFIRGKKLNINLQCVSSQKVIHSDPEIMTLILDNMLTLFINMARSGEEIRIAITDNEHGLMFQFFATKAAYSTMLTDMFRSGLSISDHLIPEQGILKPGGYGLLFTSLVLDYLKAGFGVHEEGEGQPSYWFRLPLT